MGKPRILVTGSSGFVGSWLLDHLRDHYVIDIIVSNPANKIPECNNFTSWKDLPKLASTYLAIIHLAGLAHDTSNARAEDEYVAVNLGLTKELVDWVNAKQLTPVKFIYFSSVKVYTDTEEHLTEDTSRNPVSIYGKSKKMAEDYIIERLNPIHAYTILQPVMIYGPKNKGNLPRLFNLLSSGVPYPFKNWKNKRSIVSIQNVVHTVNTLLRTELANGCYIICDDEEISTEKMIALLFKSVHREYKSFGLPLFVVSAAIKATSLLGIGTLTKLLGNLTASNQKIKTALAIKEMPFSTETGLKILAQSLITAD